MTLTLQTIENSCRADCKEWDSFLLRSPRAFHVHLSSWLDSYRPYGAIPHVIQARHESQIVGGMGVIEFGRYPFRFLHCLAGPVIDSERQDEASLIIDAAVRLAKQRRCAVFQYQELSLKPDCESDDDRWAEFVPPTTGSTFELSRHAGLVVPISTIEQMLWIGFDRAESTDNWREAMIDTFSTSTRRNIRFAEKRGVTVCEAISESELQYGFAIIEQNATDRGYAARTWREFGSTVVEQVALGHASIFTAFHEDRLLGAVYGSWAGQRFTDVMAGTIRTKPDLKIGHYVRWMAMAAAKDRGMHGYDLTADGPPGVQQAKYGFQPEKAELGGTYHFKLAPIRAQCLQLIGGAANTYRRNIANVISRFTPPRSNHAE